MTSIFSRLSNDLIIKIIQIENDRRKDQKLTMERKYNEVIQELNKLSGRHCDLDEGYWYGRPLVRPLVRARTNGICINAADVNDFLNELYGNI